MNGKTSGFTDAEKIALQAFDSFAFDVQGVCVMGAVGAEGPFALLLLDGEDNAVCARLSPAKIQDVIESLQGLQAAIKANTQ